MLDSVEVFRVLSNETLNDIVKAQPKTKEELLKIKGFKDKKFEKYGAEILNIIKGGSGEEVGGMNGLFVETKEIASPPLAMTKPKGRKSVTAEIVHMKGGVEALAKETEDRVFTVSDYLDLINVALTDFQAKVTGEVSSLDIRGNYLFFGLKDKDNGSMMSCFMWQSNYRMSGIKLEEGLEIIVYGHPNVYKAAGKMSMQVETIEHVGEGALKKAYDELKIKLTKEGLFAEEKKRPIPEYPETIGLITSKTGAVIHDFLNNIGKFGYKIKFLDSRVEGQLAVKDLIAAVRHFRNEDIDVLIMIRGGGSLESLQAFNNEMLVREIADFPKPVLVGIGHDKDVPLASLAADLAVSTPTAATKVLNSSWDRALAKLEIAKRDIFSVYGGQLADRIHFLDRSAHIISASFGKLFQGFREIRSKLIISLSKLGFRIKNISDEIGKVSAHVIQGFSAHLDGLQEELKNYEKLIQTHSPERQLKLGYGLIRANKRIVRSVDQVERGEEIDIQIHNGKIRSKVIDKEKHGA